jgi:hypothetical protein
MRPTKCECSRPAFAVKCFNMLVPVITVALNNADKATEQLFRPYLPTSRHVAVDDGGWVGPAMSAVIARDRPKIPCLAIAYSEWGSERLPRLPEAIKSRKDAALIVVGSALRRLLAQNFKPHQAPAYLIEQQLDETQYR